MRHDSLRLVRLSAFLLGSWLAIGAGVAAGVGDDKAEKEKEKSKAEELKSSFEKACRGWRDGLAHAEKPESLKGVRAVLPNKADIDYLFPKHAAKLWPLMEQSNEFVMTNAAKFGEEVKKKGPITKIVGRDVRTGDERVSYKRLLAMIPADVAVYDYTVHTERGFSGGGTFLRVKGHWIWIVDAQSMPERIDELK